MTSIFSAPGLKIACSRFETICSWIENCLAPGFKNYTKLAPVFKKNLRLSYVVSRGGEFSQKPLYYEIPKCVGSRFKNCLLQV